MAAARSLSESVAKGREATAASGSDLGRLVAALDAVMGLLIGAGIKPADSFDNARLVISPISRVKLTIKNAEPIIIGACDRNPIKKQAKATQKRTSETAAKTRYLLFIDLHPKAIRTQFLWADQIA